MTYVGDKKREYDRKWIAARRAAFFAGKRCVRCESDQDLQLDHIDPKQKIHHAVWSWSQERREAELAKCQVLCKTCHKTKTAVDLANLYGYDEPYSHGRHSMYVNHGCRCDLCKKAHAEEARKYRSNLKGN